MWIKFLSSLKDKKNGKLISVKIQTPKIKVYNTCVKILSHILIIVVTKYITTVSNILKILKETII